MGKLELGLRRGLPTRDGTGVRDYIHVEDLAEGHLKALDKLEERPGVLTYNLGTGRGCSVLEMIAAFERAAKKNTICYCRKKTRRYCRMLCRPIKSREGTELDSEAGRDAMCRDSWNWQQKNPNGYTD